MFALGEGRGVRGDGAGSDGRSEGDGLTPDGIGSAVGELD